jgi:3-hydroxyacyl-[acyl-carrier-protein] dehydratase
MDYDVKKLLPHRDPFLFIDEVLEVDEQSIVAKWFVSPDADFFKGHFPNFPIMPGVLVLEAMAQSCGVLGSHIMSQTANESSVYLLCGIEKTRFRKKVLPGDTLIFKSSVISSKRGIWKFKCAAYSEEELVCSAEILCADRSLDE